MLNKEIRLNSEARSAILTGINTLADAVKVTLGPKGKCVILGDLEKSPRVTKDGVSVAKEVKLEDSFANAGAQLIKEAAIKTLNTVGDATTTSVVLAQAMILNANNCVEHYGNAIKIKKGIEIATKAAVDYIKSVAIKVKDSDIKNIATISANNDTEIGNLISCAFEKIGRDGIITIENSVNSETTVKVINGMQFDRGYLSPHFVTDVIKDTCVLENPYILITEHKINRMKDIAFILNQVISEGRSILLIAEDFDSEVLETLKVNQLDGRLKVCPIKAPSFGDYRHEILNDLAILTGGTNISYESGMELLDTKMEMLGRCTKVLVTKNDTTIIEGKGSEEICNSRVAELKEALKTQMSSPDPSDFMIKFYRERLARLTGGIAVIYVGGTTEIELNERKDRIEDAVAATKAAIEEGVVAGGGLTYINAANILFGMTNEDKYINMGIQIVARSLTVPFITIVENAGFDAKKLYKNIGGDIGFDANTERFVNMYHSGIIDPAKASRLALENSSSIACLFLSTECVIVPKVVQQIVI